MHQTLLSYQDTELLFIVNKKHFHTQRVTKTMIAVCWESYAVASKYEAGERVSTSLTIYQYEILTF